MITFVASRYVDDTGNITYIMSFLIDKTLLCMICGMVEHNTKHAAKPILSNCCYVSIKSPNSIHTNFVWKCPMFLKQIQSVFIWDLSLLLIKWKHGPVYIFRTNSIIFYKRAYDRRLQRKLTISFSVSHILTPNRLIFFCVLIQRRFFFTVLN